MHWGENGTHEAVVLTAAGLLVAMTTTGCERTAADPAGLPDATAASRVAEPPSVGPEFSATPPRLELSTAVYDFGRVAEISSHSARVPFRNTGGSTLVISEIKTTCGCTAVTLGKREYEPGESGELEVVFDPVAPGKQKKYVNLISNAPGGVVKLMITADVEAFIEIEPRMMRLGELEFGKTHRRLMRITSPDPDFVIDTVVTTNPHITANRLGAEPGLEGGSRTELIEIVFSESAPWGGIFSWVTVTVTGRPTPDAATITHTVRARVQAKLFGALAVTPDSLRFGVEPGEAFARRIRLTRTAGTPFRVLDVTHTVNALADARFTVEPAGPNAFDLVLTATGGPRLRPSRGTIVVTTDVPGEERLEIPIIGVVRTRPAGVE